MFQPLSISQARALVADPAAAAAASPSQRHMAWLVLKASRGMTCRQSRAQRRGGAIRDVLNPDGAA